MYNTDPDAAPVGEGDRSGSKSLPGRVKNPTEFSSSGPLPLTGAALFLRIEFSPVGE